MGKKGEGIKKYKWQLQNSHGDVKYSIENRVGNKHKCMTHGPPEAMGGAGYRVGKGGKLGQL